MPYKINPGKVPLANPSKFKFTIKIDHKKYEKKILKIYASPKFYLFGSSINC